MNAVVPQDLIQAVAQISGTTDTQAFTAVLVDTVMPKSGATNQQVTAFLMVAKEYNLNPITKEIYAFPGKGGGIQPIVSIDGWLKIINNHPQFDGMEYVDDKDSDGNLLSVTCRIYRKDRKHATEMTEYMAECQGETTDKHGNKTPWGRFPARMLRHKATIQAARYAFGFSGIVDPDEGERIAPSLNDIQAQAEPVQTITTEQIAEISKLLDETASDKDKFLKWVGTQTVEQMNETQYQRAIAMLDKKHAKQEAEKPVEVSQPADGEEIPL